jgi:hypothetical protein
MKKVLAFPVMMVAVAAQEVKSRQSMRDEMDEIPVFDVNKSNNLKDALKSFGLRKK